MAADLGHADAMGNLGALLESGQGGPQSLETAREWYVKGAALQGRRAMHSLGAMLENGHGAPRNPAEAKTWYERAAALEYAPALNDLGRLHLAGAGVPKNYVLARTSFEEAARLGDANAMNNLGMLYLNGTGVQRDFNLARSWLEKAIALDHAKARENLRLLEASVPPDGAQVAARRTSCMQTCATFQRSYVTSACDRHSAAVDSNDPERVKCVSVSLTLAQQCRGSCREWAPTSLTENKCGACFQTLIACSVERASADGGLDAMPEAASSTSCLAALADCTASCRAQPVPASAASDASSEQSR